MPLTDTNDLLPALLARAARGPISLGELAVDWLPRLDKAGLVWRFAWVDENGRVCETGQGLLALVYEEVDNAETINQ